MELIIFDLGHVIVKFSWEAVCHGFAKRANIPKDQFADVLTYLNTLGYERGAVTTATFLGELNKALSIDLDLPEFTKLWNATFEEDKEVTSLLELLGQKRPLYLLSNTNENHFGFIETNFQIARHFQQIILSYEIGHVKPEAKIYEEALTRSSLHPSKCLFIDDLAENTQAAEFLGMKTIVYKGAEDLKRRLPAFNVTI